MRHNHRVPFLPCYARGVPTAYMGEAGGAGDY